MGQSYWRKLWDDWSLISILLLSLLIQILLTLIMLSRRVRFRSNFLKFLIWLCYSSADAIVLYALGMISFRLGVIKKKEDGFKEEDKLIAFWAPILTLLLGGSDMMTAYSLEDNELWTRQLLGVVGQVIGTSLVMFMVLSNFYLTYLSAAVLVVACCKCGEKIWVLWHASMDKLQKSMHSSNPGPNYPKFSKEYGLKGKEGYHLGFHEISEVHEPVDPSNSIGGDYPKDIIRAQALFPRFRRLFADLILSDHDKSASKKIFESIRLEKDAFKVVEIEIQFMYEQLHTKAMLLHSRLGLFLRCALFVTILTVTAVFTTYAVQSWNKKDYRHADLTVTIIVLASMCFQELHALWLILISYTANDWGEKLPIICMIRRRCHRFREPPRCSNYMGQFDLLDFVVKSRICKPGHWFLEMLNLEKAWYTGYVDISQGLKGFIMLSIRRLIEESDDGLEIGNWKKEIAVDILRKHNIPDCDHKLSWSMELEFDHCVLAWHIATELWFQKSQREELPLKNNMVWSRFLSRYMVHLLVNCPTMLPNGISHIRIQDTEAEMSGFFSGTKSTSDAIKKLYEVETTVEPLKVKGSISKSVLFDGRRLETGLKVDKRDDPLQEAKWGMIVDVWFHLLVCAAKQCSGSTHAKHLRRGGELLTQVWMLMAHFGLTDHFQMKQGSVISKLRKS